MRCEVVAVGTELLLGQIIDTNSSWMAARLVLFTIVPRISDDPKRCRFRKKPSRFIIS